MQRTRISRWYLAAVASLAVLTTATPLLAQKPSKGGGGTNLPPVRYQVQFWTIPGAPTVNQINDANSLGQAVGRCQIDSDGDGTTDGYRGFFYDPQVNLEFGIDLNLVVPGIPAGWVIRQALAINEFGQIAASISPDQTLASPPPGRTTAAMIDMNQDPPALYIVDDSSLDASFSMATDVNDWGDLAVIYQRGDGTYGHYLYNCDPAFEISEPLDLGISTTSFQYPQINNNRVVVGQLNSRTDAPIVYYRLPWNGPMETLSGNVKALNEGGAACGFVRVVLKANRTEDQAFVNNGSTQLFTTIRGADCINSTQDFAHLDAFNHRSHGVLLVKDLLDPADPDSVVAKENMLTVRDISDRDIITNFPTLTAESFPYLGNRVGMTLRPVPAK